MLGWSLVSVLTRKGLKKYESLMITRNALGIAAVCEIIPVLMELIITGVPVK